MADTPNSKAGTVVVVQQRPASGRGDAGEIVVVPRRHTVPTARSARRRGADGDGDGGQPRDQGQ